jgi:hypothetical protein
VFVFADDGLHVFPSLGAVIAQVEAIDVADGVYEAMFTLDGRVIAARTEKNNVSLIVTDESGLESLFARLREQRHLFESAPEDLRGIANEMLAADWKVRWPRWPSWLDRRLHGDGPPRVEP